MFNNLKNQNTNDSYSENYPSNEQHTAQGDSLKKKRIKSRIRAKYIAFSLSFALLGGIIGGSYAGYSLSRKYDIPTVPLTQSSVFESSTGYKPTINTTSENSINYVYETYKNAVVGVSTEGTTTNIFGQTTESASSGTGFILSVDGYILTNNHVIEGANKVTVTLFNNDSYEAEIVGADSVNDIALLKVEAADLSTVKTGDSDVLEVGQTVIAIGNPLGELTYTVTAGIVSAENREINENGIPINMFQTDAAINPGNSGGPIFNLDGEVVGISTAKYSSTGIEGIGFAIPINDALDIANQLKTNGYVKDRPYLGVSVTDLTAQMQTDYGLSAGVYVGSIIPDSGSAKAGMLVGDIITALGDTEIRTTNDLVSTLKNYAAGDTVEITVYRDGRSIVLTTFLDENTPDL